MIEYPKALYKGACHESCLAAAITVADVEQEEVARADGYEMYAEIYARGAEPEQVAEKRAYNRKAK